MIINGVDYYYLPGVSKAIKDFLGRYDLKKDDVPEVLAGLGYDYDKNTIPYNVNGKTISLYIKSSIPELLNLPGNRYKANQIIAKISGRNKGMNVFVSQPNIGRRRPNRLNMMGESFVERNTFGCLLESLVLSSNNIVKIFVNKDNPKDFIIFDGIYYYNVNTEGGIDAIIDGDLKSRVDYVKEKLEYAYKNKKANAKITSKNGRIIIDIDDYGSHYNVDVKRWMKNKNFIFNNKLSHEYHLVFDIDGVELSNDIKDVLVDFEDVTLPMKRFGSYLPGEVFIKNFDKIYNHIQNIDTVFKVGRTGDIGKGFTPPCVRPIGVMANEYLDYGSSSINKFEVDYKMYDQYVIGHSFVPGVYKMACNGKPATMLIKYNPNGVIKQRGVVFYNDDITVDDNLRQYIK